MSEEFLEKLKALTPVTSIHNPLIRRIASLYKTKERREQNLTIIEGFKILHTALKSNHKIQEVLFSTESLSHDYQEVLQNSEASGAQLISVSKEVLERLSKRDDPLECIATAPVKKLELPQLSLHDPALIVVAEGIEKPGNLGVLVRSASAAGADAFLSVDSQGDIFDPFSVGASLGAVFTTPVVETSSAECIKWLTLQGITTLVTSPNAKDVYYEKDLTTPLAIVVGNEHRGLSEQWLKFGKEVKIPLSKSMESLNATIAGPIVLFEALRQRNSKA
jgi:RNA methyltransferase, TrmH family